MRGEARRSHLRAGRSRGVVTTAWATVTLQFEREQTLSRISAPAADFEGIVAASIDANSDDEHDPEGPTIAFERERTAALRGEEKAHLVDVDRALARVATGKTAFAVPVDADRNRSAESAPVTNYA